jgi:hypothetical protein
MRAIRPKRGDPSPDQIEIVRDAHSSHLDTGKNSTPRS